MGEILTEEHIKSIGPGFGVGPKYYFDVVGRVAKQNIAKGTALQFQLLED